MSLGIKGLVLLLVPLPWTFSSLSPSPLVFHFRVDHTYIFKEFGVKVYKESHSLLFTLVLKSSIFDGDGGNKIAFAIGQALW